MQAAEFWDEVRRRRNQFFLTWIGWLFVGFPLVWIYSLIFPTKDELVPGVAALLTWGAFWFWVGRRLTQLRCFRCGEPAFRNPYFFMKDAKCQSCGVSYRGT